MGNVLGASNFIPSVVATVHFLVGVSHIVDSRQIIIAGKRVSSPAQTQLFRTAAHARQHLLWQ